MSFNVNSQIQTAISELTGIEADVVEEADTGSTTELGATVMRLEAASEVLETAIGVLETGSSSSQVTTGTSEPYAAADAVVDAEVLAVSDTGSAIELGAGSDVGSSVHVTTGMRDPDTEAVADADAGPDAGTDSADDSATGSAMELGATAYELEVGSSSVQVITGISEPDEEANADTDADADADAGADVDAGAEAGPDAEIDSERDAEEDSDTGSAMELIATEELEAARAELEAR